jgi:hypothetical protein
LTIVLFGTTQSARRALEREMSKRDRREARGFGRRLIPGLELGDSEGLAAIAAHIRARC